MLSSFARKHRILRANAHQASDEHVLDTMFQIWLSFSWLLMGHEKSVRQQLTGADRAWWVRCLEDLGRQKEILAVMQASAIDLEPTVI